MDSLDIFEDLDYYNRMFASITLRLPLRNLRDADDPYAMDVCDFKRRYRFTQDVVKNIILPLVRTRQPAGSQRGLPLPPEIEILVCLRFYATASFQLVAGDLLHISQPAVSRIVAKISRRLAAQHGHHIKYPTNMSAHRQQFMRLGQYHQYQGLQNVDGAIDCTHIKIVDTPGVQHHEVYRNRKSYFSTNISLNVQAVVGPAGEFLDMVARWAGSTHDSRIFQLSRINVKYQQGVHTGYLIGDSGYPCLPFLLTPVHNPTTSAEEIYNKIQIRTRIIVERAFGMWKRRFPCLRRGLGNKLSTVSAVIVACAILHNVAIHANDAMAVDEAEDISMEDMEEPGTNMLGTPDGFAVRSAIINRFQAQ